MDAETSALPTCYRHADRETRLACSSCGRPVCVDCVRTAAVGQKCLECAKPEGRARVYTSADLRSAATRAAPVSFGILAVAGALFLVGALVPPLGGALFRFGAQFNPFVEQGQIYRLFTSAFLHAGITHVLFNMWALYLFGPLLERRAGSVPFAGLYLASALAGGAAFFLFGSSSVPAVGASGAIFGLFGAWLVASYRNRHTLEGRAGLRQLLVLLGINLALPLIVPGIAWEAHVGGLLAGVVIAGAWGLDAVRGAAARTAAAAAVGALALAAVVLG